MSTKEQWEDYLYQVEVSVRSILQEIVSTGKSVDMQQAQELITSAIAERMAGRASPPIASIRRDVAFLFDPTVFTDGGGSGPLLVLRALRKKICP